MTDLKSPGIPNLILRDKDGKEIRSLDEKEILLRIRETRNFFKSQMEIFLSFFPENRNQKREIIIGKLSYVDRGILTDDGTYHLSLIDILDQFGSKSNVIYRGRQISVLEYILMRADSIDIIRKIFWVYGLTNLHTDVVGAIYLLYTLYIHLALRNIRFPYQIIGYLSGLESPHLIKIGQNLNSWDPEKFKGETKIGLLAILVTGKYVDTGNINYLRNIVNIYHLNPLEFYRFIIYGNNGSFSISTPVVNTGSSLRDPVIEIIEIIKAYSFAEEYEYKNKGKNLGNNVGTFVPDVIKILIMGYVTSPMMDIFNSLGIGEWHLTGSANPGSYLLNFLSSYICVRRRKPGLPQLIDIDFKTGRTRTGSEISFEDARVSVYGIEFSQHLLSEALTDVPPDMRNVVIKGFLRSYTDDELVSFLQQLNPQIHEDMLNLDMWGRTSLIDTISLIIDLTVLNDVSLSHKELRAALFPRLGGGHN